MRLTLPWMPSQRLVIRVQYAWCQKGHFLATFDRRSLVSIGKDATDGDPIGLVGVHP